MIRQLETCASDWARLAQSSFDADSRSLALLSVQQQTLSSLATWVEMVVLKSSLQVMIMMMMMIMIMIMIMLLMMVIMMMIMIMIMMMIMIMIMIMIMMMIMMMMMMIYL